MQSLTNGSKPMFIPYEIVEKIYERAPIATVIQFSMTNKTNQATAQFFISKRTEEVYDLYMDCKGSYGKFWKESWHWQLLQLSGRALSVVQTIYLRIKGDQLLDDIPEDTPKVEIEYVDENGSTVKEMVPDHPNYINGNLHKLGALFSGLSFIPQVAYSALKITSCPGYLKINPFVNFFTPGYVEWKQKKWDKERFFPVLDSAGHMFDYKKIVSYINGQSKKAPHLPVMCPRTDCEPHEITLESLRFDQLSFNDNRLSKKQKKTADAEVRHNELVATYNYKNTREFFICVADLMHTIWVELAETCTGRPYYSARCVTASPSSPPLEKK